MAPTTASCQFDEHWRSDCRLRISKLGDVLVKSKFDFCTSPPLLDMTVQVDQHTWKLSFVASNRRESRIIGLEYWPLRLHMNFYDSQFGVGQSVVGCLESLKNGDEVCFLNTTVSSSTSADKTGLYAAGPPPPLCQISEASTASTMPIIILCLLLIALLVSFIVGSVVWWRRRESRHRIRKHRLETSVPPLPQSKPYVEQQQQQQVPNGHYPSSKSSSRSRPALNPITEEDCGGGGGGNQIATSDGSDSKFKSPQRWRESKLIQTSLPSLEAAQNLIDDRVTTPSSRNSENGSNSISSSPNGASSQANDKEKLICSSSSSSESSV